VLRFTLRNTAGISALDPTIQRSDKNSTRGRLDEEKRSGAARPEQSFPVDGDKAAARRWLQLLSAIAAIPRNLTVSSKKPRSSTPTTEGNKGDRRSAHNGYE